MPFEFWNDRIQQATDESARRQLLGEVGLWRASRLNDLSAQRQAAFAMSRLHQANGDIDAALREARSLVSLCQTAPPLATKDETRQARNLLNAFSAPSGNARPSRAEAPAHNGDRPPRSPRAEAPRHDDPLFESRTEASNGNWQRGLERLAGRHGPATELLRAYILLGEALTEPDPIKKDRGLRDLANRLARVNGLGRPPRQEAPQAPTAPRATSEAVAAADEALAKLLGVDEIPHRRELKVKLFEDFVAQHPTQVDALASGALEHHVVVSGLKSPSPWLVGFVGLAMATGPATAVRSAISELKGREAYAVTAYEEWAFGRSVEVLAEALTHGWRYVGLRRGVLARGEPTDRKVWTLRLEKNGETRLLAVSAAEPAGLSDELAGRVASRLPHLCLTTLLLAPGAANAALRSAATALGIAVLGEDDANQAVLAALAAAPAVEAPANAETEGEGDEEARPAREPRAPREPKAAREATPREPRAPREPQAPREPRPPRDPATDPLAILAGKFNAEDPSVDELTEAIAALPRTFLAFQVARELPDRPAADLDRRVSRLLIAADRAAPADRKLNEGATLAIRIAALVGPGEVTRVLSEEPTARRYGGDGANDVVGVVAALQQQGWAVDRVLRGPTRRERDNHPMLTPLAPAMDGLWRLLVRKGELKGEVWYLADLPAEGRAGIPQLLLDPHLRAVVVKSGADLEWFRALKGPEPIPWGPAAGVSLWAAVSAWA